MASLDVSPAIADKPTPIERNGMLDGRVHKHAWLGLSASASVGVHVRADPDIIDVDMPGSVMHSVERGE